MTSCFRLKIVILLVSRLFINIPAKRVNKTILLWDSKPDIWPPAEYFGTGNAIFINSNCTYTNCFVYKNRKQYQNYNSSSFDAIIFNGKYLNHFGPRKLPMQRTPRQVFIFLLLESAERHPVCLSHYDDFFNWTIIYRLESDIPWPYFAVKTFNHETIGPRIQVPWIYPNKLSKLSADIENKIKNKKRLVAWFVSRCKTQSHREDYVASLNLELMRLTGQKVDIFGKCGSLACPKNDSQRCDSLLEKDYFFYLAMENSFDRDYVTEKFSKSLINGVVPIVLGGADYDRFAPPGSYINARKYSPEKLAAFMVNLVTKRARYRKYFKWRNHYQYASNLEMFNIVCKICAKLNKNTHKKCYQKFREWWNEDYERNKLCSRSLRARG